MATQATQQVPAAPPQPSPSAPVIGGDMGGFSGIAKMYDQARASAGAASAAQQQQIAPLEAQLDQREAAGAAEQKRMEAMYDEQMHGLNLMQQRQRLITINRAQVLRKTLPIIGIFALIGGALDGVTGAMSALGGGLAGLSQGMKERYQQAWSQYNTQVKTMFDQVKDKQAQLKAIQNDNSKTLDEKLALLKITGANMPVYNKINNSEADAYAKWVTETTLMDKRIQLAETAHKGAAAVNKRVTVTAVNDAMSQAFPFAAPDLSNAEFTGQNATAALSAARGAWKQDHQMASLQIATIAQDYMHKSGSDWPSALQHTISWLRTNKLLESGKTPTLDDTDIESRMLGGDLPQGVKIQLAPGTPKPVADAVRAAAKADHAATTTAAPKAKAATTIYIATSGQRYSAADVAAAAKKAGVSVADYVKQKGLSSIKLGG